MIVKHLKQAWVHHKNYIHVLYNNSNNNNNSYYYSLSVYNN